MAPVTQSSREVKARYRDRHREEIRVKGREYARRKRRAEGQAIRGSAEWLAKRSPDHNPKGERNGNWKGAEVGYQALHRWVRRWGTKLGICFHCREAKKQTEWANISGEYRRDLSDYIELCRSCHKLYDLRRGEANG